MSKRTNDPRLYTCHRRLHFSAGHRVFGHDGPCANLHGHNYEVWVAAVSSELDQLGMVVDFSVLKEVLGGWIDANWDHRFLVYEKDRMAVSGLVKLGQDIGLQNSLVICDFNPTAEEMARFLFHKANIMLSSRGVRVVSVEVHETDNCYGRYG